MWASNAAWLVRRRREYPHSLDGGAPHRLRPVLVDDVRAKTGRRRVHPAGDDVGDRARH